MEHNCRHCHKPLDIQVQDFGEKYAFLKPLYHITCWNADCPLFEVTFSPRSVDEYYTQDISEWLPEAVS